MGSVVPGAVGSVVPGAVGSVGAGPVGVVTGGSVSVGVGAGGVVSVGVVGAVVGGTTVSVGTVGSGGFTVCSVVSGTVSDPCPTVVEGTVASVPFGSLLSQAVKSSSIIKASKPIRFSICPPFPYRYTFHDTSVIIIIAGQFLSRYS